MTSEPLFIDRDAIRKATRKGLIAAAILAVLTIAEFFVATELEDPLLALIPFVLVKGWIILDAFMHIRDLFTDGGH